MRYEYFGEGRKNIWKIFLKKQWKWKKILLNSSCTTSVYAIICIPNAHQTLVLCNLDLSPVEKTLWPAEDSKFFKISAWMFFQWSTKSWFMTGNLSSKSGCIKVKEILKKTVTTFRGQRVREPQGWIFHIHFWQQFWFCYTNFCNKSNLTVRQNRYFSFTYENTHISAKSWNFSVIQKPLGPWIIPLSKCTSY